MRPYFRNLDSIRTVAALMVFLCHAGPNVYRFLPEDWQILFNFASNGFAGVSIFFVLSGFLITYLLLTEHQENGKISLKGFYLRRVKRIFPLYFAVLIFTFGIYPLVKRFAGMESPNGPDVWHHIFFLSNFDVIRVLSDCPGNDTMSQNVTWSISVEEQFYLVWPLIFLLNKKWWLPLIISGVVASLVFRSYNSMDGIILYYHSFAVMIDLAIGGLVAFLIHRIVLLEIFFEWFTAWKLCAVVSLSVILVAIDAPRIFTSLSFALVIAAMAFTKLDLSDNFLNKWGKYTYGIYLLHPIVLTVLDAALRLFNPLHNFNYYLFVAGAGFIITLGVSKLSYHYFEKPILKLSV